MDALALVVASEGGAELAGALELRGLASVVVEDTVGAMNALGHADFRAIVFGRVQRASALPLRAVWRVAQTRHRGIVLVYVERGVDEGVAGAGVIVVDAHTSTAELCERVWAAVRGFDPGDKVVTDPFDDDATRPDPVLLAAAGSTEEGPLLEGVLPPGGGAALLASIFAQGLTGRLDVGDGGPALFFADGEPVSVDVTAEAHRSSRFRSTAVLSAASILKEHREKVRARMHALLEGGAGNYAFHEDRAVVENELHCKVSTFGMILESRQRRQGPTGLASSFDAIAEQYLWPGVGIERATPRLVPFTGGKDIGPLVSGQRTVRRFLADIGLDPLMGALVVLTLVDGGLAALHDRPAPTRARTLPAIEPPPLADNAGEDPTSALHERVSQLYVELKPVSDPHAVLGVAAGASAEQIASAYRGKLASLSIDDEGDATARYRLDELRAKVEQARAALSADPPEHERQSRPLGGKYEIIERIGAGGMAEVFLGRRVGSHGFEKRVVIKRVRTEKLGEPDIVRMFLEEARIAGRLTHSNVVQIFDLGQAGGQNYIVMEYVDGVDLAELIAHVKAQRAQVPADIAAYIVAEACAGLEAAHTHKDDRGRPAPIIHRDVSTQNVLVSFDGHVKIADFGVAKRSDAASHTEPGQLKGKPAYLAPEYIRGAPADVRSDVFAAGLVLYTALAGAHPLENASAMQAMHRILEGSLPPIEATRKDVPTDLRGALLRALAHNPADRFPSAQAFRLALLSFLAAHGGVMSPLRLAAFMEEVAAGLRRQPWRKTVPEAAAEPGATPVDEATIEATIDLRWPYPR